ncbi:hypothetical protein RZE82_01770 [Mollicutes bacterium LVI A0039]|nr:hypothetical protein RZE82_01770 [Mollicutes bacterium LVI A0039]
MIEFHKRVATYNLVNIISTAVLLFVQFLNLTVWSSWYLLLLDDETIVVILFWPLLILSGIILFNKSVLRKFIHTQNKAMYEANNVNADFENDSGSLDSTAWEALPTSSASGLRVKKDADMKFHGKLEDIGINYFLDEITYSLSRKRGDETDYLGRVDGEALVVKIPSSRFGSDWTLYINDAVKFSYMQIKQSNELRVNVGNESGRILYNDDTVVDSVKRIVINSPKQFANCGKVIAMFKEDTFIYITTAQSKFKIKLPFVISKPRLEQIIVDQKAQVYRFNQFLVDISRTLEL